ncbi:hypothetical protein CEE37_13470 [candidate division LCP-89 bacterium B3_LCP]|uniref:Outer membrane protein beta-barrel domain-containing protein n=1 Tax=candidate division LCP-89 bacterium B3_LCP TaxID=2012998 RepID=A0A532USS0_UNCL8|nr:MAG: hypothetical protein CEE37_13470 [candidate division LCP-89 bacterium B3_LCP]
MYQIRISVFIIFMISLTSYAAEYELDQNSVEISGMGYFTYTKSEGSMYGITDNENHTEFYLSPSVHYFIIEKLTLGGTLEFYSDDVSNGSHQSAIGFGPTVQYFFGNKNIKQYPFVGTTVSFKLTSLTATDLSKYSASEVSYKIFGGYFLKLIDHFGIKIAPFYKAERHTSGETDETATNTSYGIEFGFSGFIY